MIHAEPPDDGSSCQERPHYVWPAPASEKPPARISPCVHSKRNRVYK